MPAGRAAGPGPARSSAVSTPDLSPPPLLLVAHGSRDLRFAEVVEGVATALRRLAPDLDVRVGYLEHGPPLVADVAEPGAVAVPLLLSAGYHVRVDLPRQAPGVVVAGAVGPDERFAHVLAERLAEAGYAGGEPVTLAAAGSADGRALDDVTAAASHLAARLGVPVTPAYVSAGSPRLAHVAPRVVASYLLAPGVFMDAVTACGAEVVAAPIGAHPLVAEIALDRYRAAASPP